MLVFAAISWLFLGMTPQYRSAGTVADSVEDQLVLMAVVFRSEFENV